MNFSAASDLEAADLLALARLDDDGAPCPSGPPRPRQDRPDPGNDRGHGARAADPLLPLTPPPEGSGEHAAGGAAGLDPAVPAAASG